MKQEFQSLIIKQIGLIKTFQDTLSDLVNVYLENKKSNISMTENYQLLLMPDF